MIDAFRELRPEGEATASAFSRLSWLCSEALSREKLWCWAIEGLDTSVSVERLRKKEGVLLARGLGGALGRLVLLVASTMAGVGATAPSEGSRGCRLAVADSGAADVLVRGDACELPMSVSIVRFRVPTI